MWTKVTGFFDFGEEGFSISALFGKAWDVVTGYFSFAGKVWIGIGGLFDAAWTKVTGWLGFGDKTWSLSDVFKTAWETITGFFSFGSGEGAVSFSISGLLTTAWETVTGFFGFEGIQIPSISSLFQGIIDTVKGFFTFDFEMPNFKQYLPKWLGGEGKSLFGGSDDVASATPPEPPSIDATPAADGANALMDAQSAMASFSNIEGLENNLNAIKNGLDIDGVTSYTEAMKQLVAVLEELNAELNKDNYTGYGNGTNAGTVVDKMQTIGSGGGGSSEELNNTMQQVLSVLNQIKNGTELTANNTRNIVGSNLARSGVSNIAR
jgi:hypothetical protein